MIHLQNAFLVHWFNPLVYFVRREMNKACELACDESVIKRFDNSELHKAFLSSIPIICFWSCHSGNTLIVVAADSIRTRSLSITMIEDKKNLKERLDAIMKHKTCSKRTVIAASVILVMTVFHLK